MEYCKEYELNVNGKLMEVEYWWNMNEHLMISHEIDGTECHSSRVRAHIDIFGHRNGSAILQPKSGRAQFDWDMAASSLELLEDRKAIADPWNVAAEWCKSYLGALCSSKLRHKVIGPQRSPHETSLWNGSHHLRIAACLHLSHVVSTAWDIGHDESRMGQYMAQFSFVVVVVFIMA